MSGRGFARTGAVLAATTLLAACTIAPPAPRPASEGHLGSQPPAPARAADIPAPVKRRPFVPPPVPAPPEETFTVVVNQVPVRELLFALARDANVNVDVHPEIEGNVTLNAIDQSLYQILDRISRQLAVRYETRDETLVIVPDTPFLRSYRVDYVNISREVEASIGAESTVRASGGTTGENTSDSKIDSRSENKFWDTLVATLGEIVAPDIDDAGVDERQRVIANREGGIVIVRANASQHEMVQHYLDRLMASVGRQVLIEATIVEVQLNDRYQAGINWQVFTRQGGLLGAGITLCTDVGGAFTAGASGAISGLIFNASDAPTGSPKREVEVSLRLLNEFGDTTVLSSPKVMTLNNQPAMLKVVDNEVFFEVTTDIAPGDNNTDALVSFNTDVRTVSVGLVMSVVPQVSEADDVTLSVRPTITRIREFVEDPAVPVALAQAGIQNVNVANRVPVVQVRESESVMRVGSGQLAILGGLMQDRQDKDDESVPGASEIPGIGELFNFRERGQTKTELVVFLRPTVIRTPDVSADLASFRPLLPENLPPTERQRAPFVPALPAGEGTRP